MQVIVRVLLPLLLLSYISYETYLKLNNSSICESSGCQLAAQLLKFDAIYLNFIGIFGLTLLTIIGFKSLKNESFLKTFNILLYAALFFETTLFAFQLIVNSEPCFFCLGVITSLILITILHNKSNALVTITSIVAIFIALNVLAVPTNKPTITATGNYLIESSTCEHCKNIKEYFNTNNIEYTSVSIHNPNSISFLKFLNISSVPTLVTKEHSSVKITTGEENIMQLFEKVSVITPTVSDDFLTAGSNDGCEIAIVPEPCKDDINKFEVTK